MDNIFSGNFEHVSEEEFFNQVKKGNVISDIYFYNNDKLIKNAIVYSSSKVLEYAIKNSYKKEVLLSFYDVAFTSNNLKLILEKNIEFTLEEYEGKFILLNNVDILKKAIKKYPEIFRKLDSKKINKDIVKLLEKNIYNIHFNKEDLLKYPILATSNKIVMEIIKHEPDTILIIDDLTEEMINCSIENGFIPKKIDFFNKPILKTNENLLKIGFEHDPSIAIFYDEESLKYTIGYLAQLRGYKVTEEDLLYNPSIGASSNLMRDAIKTNPYLIKYVREGCFLKDSDILEALESYRITENDILMHPSICKSQIIRYLPEFELYNYYLPEERKIEVIYEHLKEGKSLTEIPFFKKILESRINPELLDEIWKYMDISIKESDRAQEFYYIDLKNIIESILLLRYEKNRKDFSYSNIIDLNNDILSSFMTDNIDYIVDKIYNFAGKMIPIEYLRDCIYSFNKVYTSTNNLDISTTYVFCNYILNLNKNYYFNQERKKIKEQLKYRLKLTDRKLSSLTNSIKIPIITDIIKNRKYEQLDTSYEQINKLIDEIEQKILNNRIIIRANIKISEEQFKLLRENFINEGKITLDLSKLLNINDKKIVKYIKKLYENIRMVYIKNISLSSDDMTNIDLMKEKLDVNPFNYKICSKQTYMKKIAILFSKINDEVAHSILNGITDINQLKDYLPFIGIINEFDIDTLINLLVNYSKIKEKVGMTSQSNSDSINKFKNLISLANGYGSIDNILMLVLTPEIIDTIGVGNINEFLDFYKEMLVKKSGYIPSVNIEYNNMKLVSGQFSDPRRLLIGRINNYSCIDLTSAGKDTFKECLASKTGDAIMISDANNNLVSRILLVRRGNVLQLIVKEGTKFPYKLYKKISDEILQKALLENDNIEYIVISKSAIIEDNLPYIEDPRFKSEFPHADLSEKVVLLGSKYNSNNNLNLDFHITPKKEYYKERQPVDFSPTEEKITRLKALKILLTKDEMLRKILYNNFDPFYIDDYKFVVCGEDWYFAETKDGNFIEEIINDGDIRAYEELTNVKEFYATKYSQLEVNLKK